MNKLEKARDYESKNVKKITSDERPLYHMTPAIGWMNDPNGFSVYQGEYHLFYQYYPYDTKWGEMHWGHYKTKDFLKWEILPAALAPDEAYESGCFSGSALEREDGKHLLMYTAHLEEGEEEKTIIETQCIAIGDGIDYVKYEENPVIQEEDLPEDFCVCDFRDPKIWKTKDKYYAICANRAEDGAGQLLLFSSEDAMKWKYEKTLERCFYEYGDMWECPDYFELENKDIFVISPMNMKAKDLEFHNGHSVIGMIGTLDKESWSYKREQVQNLEYGLDFYAPQTVLTPDGRRVMIGWMQSWASSTFPPEKNQWFGMMTVPRELTLKDGRIYQNPVRELLSYRQDPVIYENIDLQETLELDGVSGRTIDFTIEVDFSCSESKYFTMKIAADDRYYSLISFDVEKESLTVDRTYSGVHHDIVNMRTFPAYLKNGKLKLRVLLDRFSVEVFVNDGEQAFSMTLYHTPMSADKIVFGSEKKVKMNVEKYAIITNE